jgi:hypothetical protein
MSEELTVTIPEFAKLARISKNHAYMLASSDSLGVPVLRFGKRLLLSRRAVLRLLDAENNEGNGNGRDRDIGRHS